MRKLFLVLLFLAISSTAFAKGKAAVVQKPIAADWDKWAACQSTVDCNVVVGVCGTLEAINHNFIQEHEAYVTYASQSVRCAAISKDLLKDRPPVVCVQKQCALMAAQ